ncbi:hypothetical protein AMK68_04320 [candidate division KD3-62 bacterium DG_56]|uniref:Uncharacterized protein n=1 Tax=candidate division KD3-62 bacterium DG_56 TaxID=1704032 RepID=A0A0S7XKF7_9BACT|nr:MAG: hypothetical protein AMK68_04320 [candidate division KD3-62 bacterium DG_56]
MLAEARLHKSRQQYEQAIAKCMQVLEQQPGNATACSLLGDVERARGRLPKAAEWYKQAAAADQTSVADRQKLDEVLDLLYLSTEGAAAGTDSPAATETEGAGRRLPWIPLLIGLATLVIVVIAAAGGYKLATSKGISVSMPTGSALSRPHAGPGAVTPTSPPRRPTTGTTPPAVTSSGFMGSS